MSVLNRIVVRGFKSIKEMDLELRNLNVLIGANGSGKSNFLSSFQLLDAIAQKRLQSFIGQSGGADNLLHFGRKVTGTLGLRVYFTDQYGYEAKLLPDDVEDRLFFDVERYIYVLPKEQSVQYVPPEGLEERGHRETILHKFMGSHVGAVASNALENLQRKVYHFHDTSNSAKVRLTADNIHDIHYLRPDASNLAPMLYWFQRAYPDHYDRIVKTIQLAAPFFDDFILQPEPDNPDTIRLRWRQKGFDKTFYASHLSDGTLRLICLATLLMQPEPPYLIIIDEPELGLHPYALELVASMIQSAATQRQIIVATQSAPFINYFSPEDIIVVDLEDNQSTFKRLKTDALKSWLEDYSLGEIWEKNIVGGTP